MNSNHEDQKLNRVLFGVNIALLVLLVVGMVVYFNIRHKRKIEFEQDQVSNPARMVDQTKTKTIANNTSLDKDAPAELQLPSRNDSKSADVASASDSKDVIEDIKDVESNATAALSEDIKDIIHEESEVDKESGLVGELSVDYNDGKELLSGSQRARLILLETEDMNLVDQLASPDDKDNTKNKRPSALDKAAENQHNGRRPNYGKVRKGLIGVAEALVRLNTRIVEVEPLKKDEEAVTSLEYNQ